MAYLPTLNHLAIVQAARARYPAAKLTADECAALCHDVARHCIAAGESDCGVMLKSAGNYGVVAGHGYAVDIILYQDSAVWVDCLRDAGDRTTGPGSAQPAWQGPQPGSVAAWAPPVPESTAPPSPSPPPPNDLAARVAALELAVAGLEARFQSVSRAAAGNL